jgi:hypothetical protein
MLPDRPVVVVARNEGASAAPLCDLPVVLLTIVSLYTNTNKSCGVNHTLPSYSQEHG